MDTKFILILITFLISITESVEKYLKQSSLKKVDIISYLAIESFIFSLILFIYIILSGKTNKIYQMFNNIDDFSFKHMIYAIMILLINKFVKYYLLSNYNLLDVLVYDDLLDIIVISLVSYFFLNESISKEKLLGIIIIIIGMYIFYKY
tara:strand:- start:652 stop:1098 length:447 start_codon:yes stop_codon:yes gene_type:complete